MPATQLSPLASLSQVHKRYGPLTVLKDLSLSVERGKVLALLGPNGAGKTTAVSLLLDLVSPDAGAVSLFGLSPDTRSAKQRIGVLLQSADLPETLRVAELIALTQSYYPQPRPLAELCALTGISELLTRPYGKLSGGQQRQVQFALAICAQVELLFLDEPTVGLDIQARETLWRCVRQLVASGCAVVLTTHYLEEAEALADRVIVIGQGSVLAQGTVADIRAHVALRRIRCVSRLSSAEIQVWPEVESVSTDGPYLLIQTVATEAVVRRLLAADPDLQQLEIKHAGLAEAFVELTKETLQ